MRQPPEQRAQRHGGLAAEHHPERHVELRRRDGLAANSSTGDDAHGLLRVVAAMPQRVERGRDELQDAKGAVDGERRAAHEDPGDRQHQKRAPARSRAAATGRWRRRSSARPFQTMAPLPALAMPAPISPPISACELLEGMPAHQVIRFQAMAPMSAAKITRGVDDARGR